MITEIKNCLLPCTFLVFFSEANAWFSVKVDCPIPFQTIFCNMYLLWRHKWKKWFAVLMAEIPTLGGCKTSFIRMISILFAVPWLVRLCQKMQWNRCRFFLCIRPLRIKTKSAGQHVSKMKKIESSNNLQFLRRIINQFSKKPFY